MKNIEIDVLNIWFILLFFIYFEYLKCIPDENPIFKALNMAKVTAP
jgi:hypothetical protein